MEHQRPRHIDPSFVGEIPYINRDIIADHLDAVSLMDKRALFDTLVPHRALPINDAARYVIEEHRQQDVRGSLELQTSYELGVVFGRSLLVRATRDSDEHLLPVVTDLNQGKQELIDDYLKRAVRRTARDLTSMDWQINPYLERAVELFCGHCDEVAPSLMLDGHDEVKRGVHDYLSVVTLLEAESKSQKSKFYKRLGVVGAVALLAYTLKNRFRHTAA